MAIAARYKGYRYPIEVIGHAVWLYHRFALSLRDVEELMLARGVVVTYETIRSWCAKFGPDYAARLRRRRPRPGDKWHLDEVFVKINGTTHYLWRAVDQHGDVLDILVQSRRNALAAKRFFRKLLKGLRYVPRVIVTDKLASYQLAHRELLPSVTHRRSKYLNNRVENSESPWKCWRLLTLETRMQVCRKNSLLGSRRHADTVRKRRPPRCGWCGRCAPNWVPSRERCNG